MRWRGVCRGAESCMDERLGEKALDGPFLPLQREKREWGGVVRSDAQVEGK
jgi:hypothetical protein